MRHRRVRPPGTQLARAGERTLIIKADIPVPEVRFRASVMEGAPTGRILVDRADGPETLDLQQETRIDGDGLIAITVVPDRDTAITFQPAQRPGNAPLAIAGFILLVGGMLWTSWEFLGF